MCIFLFLTTSKSKTWTKCLTVFYFKVFKFYLELIESLLCLLVVDDKFNGFDVSVCHNKNDALILVIPKISASLSDKKRHLNGLYCVSCYSVPKTGRQRIYNHFCSFSELKKSLHRHLFLKSGARLAIMPKELKGFPYRISFKVLQIYGNNFIRAPFAWDCRKVRQLPRRPRRRLCLRAQLKL